MKLKTESKKEKAERVNTEALLKVWKELMREWSVKEITLPQELSRIGQMKY